MLERPPLADEAISQCLRTVWAIEATEIAFLPLGADIGSSAFLVRTTEGRRYFLKVRSGEPVAISVRFPHALAVLGVDGIAAPIAGANRALLCDLIGYSLALYDFIEGESGFERPLAPQELTRLGRTVRRMHDAELPRDVSSFLPTEVWSDRWRLALDRHLAAREKPHTPTGEQLREILDSEAATIRQLIDRSHALAARLSARALPYVPCHGDLHGGNVLGAPDGVRLIDWDTAILAPRERDLMFVGGGIGGVWSSAADVEAFYEGYGTIEPDPAALAYYRTDRIVEDIAVSCDQVFGQSRDSENSRKSLRIVANQFGPGSVVEVALATSDGAA